MEWISENWLWLLLAGGFVGMHFFGHGGRGGCGGGHGHGQGPTPTGGDATPKPSEHRH